MELREQLKEIFAGSRSHVTDQNEMIDQIIALMPQWVSADELQIGDWYVGINPDLFRSSQPPFFIAQYHTDGMKLSKIVIRISEPPQEKE